MCRNEFFCFILLSLWYEAKHGCKEKKSRIKSATNDGETEKQLHKKVHLKTITELTNLNPHNYHPESTTKYFSNALVEKLAKCSIYLKIVIADTCEDILQVLWVTEYTEFQKLVRFQLRLRLVNILVIVKVSKEG